MSNSQKRASDYGVSDPVFDGMSLVRFSGARWGEWFVRCECWQFKPADKKGYKSSRKRAEGQSAVVGSLGAARDWAQNHLNSPNHVPAA